ncbi:MAG: phosphopantetheine-binding protein [Thermoleophilaceae bacterium]
MAATATKESVERTIADALEQVGADAEEIKPDATFEALDVDSLDLVEVAQVVEEEYGVEITGEDAQRFETVRDAVEFVANRAS